MVHKRYFPGVFQTINRSKLYAFGGEHDSIERLDLKEPDNIWSDINIKLPSQISTKNNFIMLPIWKYPFKCPDLIHTNILIFGGLQKEIFVIDTDSHKINALKTDGVMFSN